MWLQGHEIVRAANGADSGVRGAGAGVDCHPRAGVLLHVAVLETDAGEGRGA